jgi:hypothetical protein
MMQTLQVVILIQFLQINLQVQILILQGFNMFELGFLSTILAPPLEYTLFVFETMLTY